MHLEPDPRQWLDGHRLDRLTKQFSPLTSTLATAGLLYASLEQWLRYQLADEAPWAPGEREQLAGQRQAEWIKLHASDPVQLDPAELVRRLTVKKGCQLWAAHQWSHRSETLFLTHKQSLDKASCLMLQVSDYCLARELSFRLQAGEERFETVRVLNANTKGGFRFNPYLASHSDLATCSFNLHLARLPPRSL